MGTKQTIGFGGGMIIGILVGAVIDNMALGIILGCLLGTVPAQRYGCSDG